MSRAAPAAVLAVSASALVVAVGEARAAAVACEITGPFGSGRSQVWLLEPGTEPKSIVVFAHGWTTVEPTDWHRARFDHLCRPGSIVVFPRYQLDGPDTGFRRGVQTAFARLRPVDVPVVVAGFSFGGALAAYYAGNADGWGVPRPYGVLSVFPTTRVAGRPAGRPPRSTRFVLLAGDRDLVVGTAGTQDLLAWLKGHPLAMKTSRLVRSSSALVAHREAPKEMTVASTRLFWTPIDTLVTAARRAA